MFIHRPLAVAAAAALLCAVSPAALAQTIQFDQPAQALASALTQFGQRAGLTIMAPQALVAGRQAPALRGPHTAQSGLAALLANSGLEAVIQARVVTLRQRPAPTPAEASAQPSAGANAGVQLAEVQVLAERSIEPANTTSSQTLGREALERFSVTNPGDLLRDVTGVSVANSRNGSSLDVNIRGMQGFGRVKILVDGTESSGSTYKGYAGDTTQSYVDPELLGEVKVEKGPNAGPYGAGVVGGVVSMSTLTADDLITDGRSYGLRLRGTTVGNTDNTNSYQVLGPGLNGSSDPLDGVTRTVSLPRKSWNGSVAGAWRLLDDKLELVAGLSHRQSGNYVSGSRGDVWGRNPAASSTGIDFVRLSLYQPGQTVYNTSQDTDSTLLKAALKLPHDQKISLGYSRLESVFGEARSAAFPDYIAQLNLSSVDKSLYTAQYSWKPALNPWVDLKINLWSADSSGYQAADFRSPGLLHNATWNETRGHGLEAWNTSVLEVPVGELSLKYGVTWLSEKADVTPLDGGVYMDPSGQRTLGSAFLQAELQPTDWLLINAGLRREQYEVRGVARAPSGIPGQVVPLDIKHGEGRTNPSLGFAIQPSPSLQFFGRYSEGWRPPTPKETINSLTAATNLSRTLLTPEYTRSTEAGVKFTLNDQWLPRDRFHAGLTLFHNVTDGYMYGFAGEFGNAEQARTRGVEFNLDYDAGTFFARYGHTRYTEIAFCGVINQPGCIELPGTASNSPSASGLFIPPKAQQNLTLGVRLLERRLTLGLRMTAADDLSVNEYAVDGWRSYAVYDLFGSWRINRNLNLGFSVENLRDRFYMEASTSALLAIPSPGRTAKVTLSYTF